MLGVSILFSLLTLGYALTKQDAGKTLQPLILSIVLTQIAILIWSSVVVFGKFKAMKWSKLTSFLSVLGMWHSLVELYTYSSYFEMSSLKLHHNLILFKFENNLT